MDATDQILNNNDQALTHYTQQFRLVPPHKFAVIKISGNCIQHNLETIIQDIKVLKDMQLTPVLVAGWGTLLQQRLKQTGQQTYFIDGNRVTSLETLNNITDTITQISKQIIHLAHHYNVDIQPFHDTPLFDATPLQEELGYVAQSHGVDTAIIKTTCAKGTIPVLFPLGKHGQQIYNINADTAARTLVEALRPLKYIALTPNGGVLDSDGKIIKKISITDDYQTLTQSGVVSGGMKKKLDEARALLVNAFAKYSVHLTSPDALLKELFTYQGSGTKISNQYHLIHAHTPHHCNIQQIRKVIENGLGGQLPEEYFIQNTPHIIFEQDYDGVACLRKIQGWTHLDKLVVIENARSNGLGNKLFKQALIYSQNQNTQGLVWRSKRDNPVKKWYDQIINQYNGASSQCEDWNMYWIGQHNSSLPDILNYLATKPADITPRNIPENPYTKI